MDLELVNRQRVLLLAYNYPPENVAGAARPFRFAKYLPECGYQVTVLTASDQKGARPERVHCVPKRLTFYEKIIRKLFLPGDSAISWIRPAVAASKALIKQHGITAVISTSPPAWAHVAAMRLQRSCGVKWIADFRDPIRGSSARLNHGYPYLDRVLEPLLLRHADRVITNTDTVRERWRAMYPREAEKISLLWNGFDPEDEAPRRPIPRRAYRLLTHAGEITYIREPGLLLASVARLSGRGLIEPGSLKIQLIGDTTESLGDAAARDTLAGAGILEKVPLLPAAEADARVAESDYLLLLDVTIGATGLQVPSKIFGYIRIGRPILAVTSRNSPVERILKGSGVPSACLYPDMPAEEVDRTVLEFLKLAPEPAEASEWFRETFDGLRQTRALAHMLDEMNGRPSVL